MTDETTDTDELSEEEREAWVEMWGALREIVERESNEPARD